MEVEQPVPHGIGREIHPMVIEDIERRAELGEERYGERLRAHNGRSALIDAYEEALDLAIYLRQEIEERGLIEPEPQDCPGCFGVHRPDVPCPLGG